MSKAFDKVWHEGLLYKFNSTGISGKLYNPLENYLSGRRQRVIFSGQTSLWRPVLTGVSKGLVLGPLLFWSTSIMSIKMATVTDKKESVNFSMMI